MTKLLSSWASERHLPITENARLPQLSADSKKGSIVLETTFLLPTSARRIGFFKSVKWEPSQRGSTKLTFILWTEVPSHLARSRRARGRRAFNKGMRPHESRLSFILGCWQRLSLGIHGKQFKFRSGACSRRTRGQGRKNFAKLDTV